MWMLSSFTNRQKAEVMRPWPVLKIRLRQLINFLPIRKIVLFARRKVGSRTEPDSRISDVLTIISTAGTLLNFHSGMTEIRFFHSTNAGASFLRCRPHGESRKKNSLRESL